MILRRPVFSGPYQLFHGPSFLGAESFAGYVVMSQKPDVYHMRQEEAHFQWEEDIQSMIGHPLQRGGAVAGALLLSCPQPNFFLPRQQRLIQSYVHLAALAFSRCEFYSPQSIHLQEMPAGEKQAKHVQTLKHRILWEMKKSQTACYSVAQRYVLQQVENELLTSMTRQKD